MNAKRIIARLDIKGPNLVKGIHLEGLRVLGKPWDFARYYYESGADELMFQDTVASLYDRNSLPDIIMSTAKEVFIPLTVGGGLRTVADISRVLRCGADKVSLNTAAIKNPQFVEDAARMFGSSTIVVAIEAIRQPHGEYLAYVDNGREHTGREVVAWAKQVESLGAGEIIVTSVDRDGTGKGFDIQLTRAVAEAVSIPVIAHGGAATVAHIRSALTDGWADSVAVASILHYGSIASAAEVDQGDFRDEGNIEFIKRSRSFKAFGPESIGSIKERLSQGGIACRL